MFIKKIFYQFIKFGLVGISNTLISLAIYYIMVWMGFHYIVANLVGFVITVINSFYWNNKYVFKKQNEKNKKKSFVKMACSYGLTALLSNGLLFLFIDVMNISKYIAPLICLMISVPLNFVLNKIWAFKDKV